MPREEERTGKERRKERRKRGEGKEEKSEVGRK